MSEQDQLQDWLKSWNQLCERVDVGSIPLKQYNTIVKLWYEVSKAVEGIEHPAIIYCEPDYQLKWCRGDDLITLEVKKNGVIEWRWINWDSHQEYIRGNGNIQECLMAMKEKLEMFR